MRIAFESFRGIAPKIRKLKLPEGVAQVAQNVRTDSQGLGALHEDIVTTVAIQPQAKSVYNYRDGTGWLSDTGEREYQKSFTANDVHKRIYFTDGKYPKVQSGNLVYRLGLPKPDPIAIIAGGLTATEVEALDANEFIEYEFVSWICTFVSPWGEEGPASTPSTSTYRKDGNPITLRLPSVPTAEYNLGEGALIRVYRGNTSTSGATAYQFAFEVPIASAMGNTKDEVESADLQEVAPTQYWFEPPNDDKTLYPDGPLRCLTELPNNVFAGFTGNSVYFSSPGVPYAWPYENVRTTSSKIVAISATTEGTLVATEEKPYLIAGHEPGSMVAMEISLHEPCLSKRSMVNMGGWCMYAGASGLVGGSGMDLSIMTTELLTERDWKSMFIPESIHGYRWGNRYVGFYGVGAEKGGFIYDPSGENGFLTTLDFYASAGWYDAVTDVLFLVVDGKLVQFCEGPTKRAFVWRSKDYTTGEPMTLNSIRLQGEGYPFTVNVYGDNLLVDSVTLEDNLSERLMPFDSATIWSFEIIGSGTVDYLAVADNLAELD